MTYQRDTIREAAIQKIRDFRMGRQALDKRGTNYERIDGEFVGAIRVLVLLFDIKEEEVA